MRQQLEEEEQEKKNKKKHHINKNNMSNQAIENLIGEGRHKVHSVYKSFAEYFITLPKESQFHEKGILTPEG